MINRSWGDSSMRPALEEAHAGGLKIWDFPVNGKNYVVGADVAERAIRDIGAARRSQAMLDNLRSSVPDYSAAMIIERDTGQHVASYHADIEPSDFAEVLCAISWHYNQAHLIIEKNGPGEGVLDKVFKVFQYPNLYVDRLYNRAEADTLFGSVFGWRTSKMNRGMLIQRVQEWVNHAPLTRDFDLIDELRTMQYDEQGKARAIGRDKDDRVFALGLALQARYELLYGHIGNRGPQETDSHLPHYDQMIWRRMDAERERTELDNRTRTSPGTGGLRSLPSPRRLGRGYWRR